MIKKILKKKKKKKKKKIFFVWENSLNVEICTIFAIWRFMKPRYN